MLVWSLEIASYAVSDQDSALEKDLSSDVSVLKMSSPNKHSQDLLSQLDVMVITEKIQ